MNCPSFTADEMIKAFTWSRHPIDKLRVNSEINASPIHTIDRLSDFSVTPDNLSNPHRILDNGTCDLYMGNYPLALINPSSEKPLVRVYDNTTRKLVDIPAHLLSMSIEDDAGKPFIRTSGRFIPIYDNGSWNCDISKKGYVIGFVSKFNSDVKIGYDAYKVIYLDGTVKQLSLQELVHEVLYLHILNVYCPVAKSLFCTIHDTEPLIEYFTASQEPITKDVEERVLLKIAWLHSPEVLSVVKGHRTFESLHMNPNVGSSSAQGSKKISCVRDILKFLATKTTTSWADPIHNNKTGILGCSSMAMRELYMCYEDELTSPYFASWTEPNSIFNYHVSSLNDGGKFSYNLMLNMLRSIIKTEGDLFALVAYLAEGNFNVHGFEHRSNSFGKVLNLDTGNLSLIERCAVLMIDLMVSTQGSHIFYLPENYFNYAQYAKAELLRLKMMGINMSVNERLIYGGIALRDCQSTSDFVRVPSFVNVIPTFLVFSVNVSKIEITAENANVTCYINNSYLDVVIDSLGVWSDSLASSEHTASIRVKSIEVTGSVLNIPANAELRFINCVDVRLNNTDSVKFRPLPARKIEISLTDWMDTESLVLRNINPIKDIAAVWAGSFNKVWLEEFNSIMGEGVVSLVDTFLGDYKLTQYPLFLIAGRNQASKKCGLPPVMNRITCDAGAVVQNKDGNWVLPMQDAFQRDKVAHLSFVGFVPDSDMNFPTGFAGHPFNNCVV